MVDDRPPLCSLPDRLRAIAEHVGFGATEAAAEALCEAAARIETLTALVERNWRERAAMGPVEAVAAALANRDHIEREGANE